MNTSGDSIVKKILWMALDLAILYGSFMLAYVLRFHHGIPPENLHPFFSLAPWVGAAALLIFYFFDLYATTARKHLVQMLQSVIVSEALLALVIMALSFWGRGFAFPRTVIFLGMFLETILAMSARVVAWSTHWMTSGKRRVLIVSTGSLDAARYREKLARHAPGWFAVAGTATADQVEKEPDILDDVDVLLLSPRLSREHKEFVLRVGVRCGKEVLLVPDAYELFLAGSQWQQIDDLLVLSVTPPTLSPFQRSVKRLVDVVASAVLIMLTSPLMILLFVLVPLTSPGPALYRQERLGERRKPFVLYKFRSMVRDAEKLTGPVLASEDDPRITPLGRLMRSTRLDELPQLFNVLKGDMSLVGPRPERRHFVEQFEQDLPHYGYRMAVKPGITGLAQVMANYSTTAEDKLRYDLLYIRNYSILLDIKILFQTLAILFRRDRSAGVRQEDVRKEAVR
ncbi:sugar transferase [Kyrpidia sp.]|uniref:sugar transferase n=1 Tax=Kyrpidia sp. TaxID=2073077 RepID=UPI002585682F|nr:sugar transferase [Kyrpidia sp.]MCL6577688.1 sugar transferase [Kyrpidia sp.]